MQSTLAGALVLFGAFTQDGFKSMVEYTAPVFWGFLLLVGISCFVLRGREPVERRPFPTTLHLLKPAFFCLTCTYLLYSSLVYTGWGAIVGVVVLLLGIPLLMIGRKAQEEAAVPLGR